jgi:hypothetical protein
MTQGARTSEGQFNNTTRADDLQRGQNIKLPTQPAQPQPQPAQSPSQPVQTQTGGTTNDRK